LGVVGGSEYISIPSPSATAIQGFTVSGWIKPNGSSDPGASILTDIYSGNINYVLGRDEGGGGRDFFGGFYNGSGWHRTPDTTLADGVWTYLVATYDGSTIKLYVNNNAALTTATTQTLNTNNAGARISARWDVTGSNVSGVLDEIRLSNVARSADWILAEYNNQSSPSTFYSIGGAATS